MSALLLGCIVLSLFHALIPSHWLPIVAIARQHRWALRRTLWVTLVVGLAHVLSTVLLGMLLALLGHWISNQITLFTRWVAPVLLMALGLFYFYQHHRHHHFHLRPPHTNCGVVGTLAIAMFFSPCLEVEGYFLAAGQYGWPFVGMVALVYTGFSVAGMLAWVWLASNGLKRLDWHAWEHSAGLITGLTLITSGVALLVWE